MLGCPPVVNRDGSRGGGELSGGGEGEFMVERGGGKRIRPHFFEGVGDTTGIAGRGVLLVPLVKGGGERQDVGEKV